MPASKKQEVFAEADDSDVNELSEDAIDQLESEDDTPIQHFYAFKLEPGQTPAQFSLEGTDLHITQAALEADGEGKMSRVYVETPASERALVATLRSGTASEQVLLDLALYNGDEQVMFYVEGDAPVHFSGVANLYEQLEESDDDDSEAEEEEAAIEAAAAAEGGDSAEEEEEEEEEESDDEAAQAAVAAAMAKASKGTKRGREEAAAAPAAAKKSRKEKAAPAMQTAKNGLKYMDVEPGMGKLPRSGKKVTVAYEGRLAKNGKLFDSSNNFTFRLGVGKVIAGWDIGVASMKEGGKRKLIVPPHLGYGKSGAGGGVIPPNATLEFIVTLKKAQ